MRDEMAGRRASGNDKASSCMVMDLTAAGALDRLFPYIYCWVGSLLLSSSSSDFAACLLTSTKHLHLHGPNQAHKTFTGCLAFSIIRFVLLVVTFANAISHDQVEPFKQNAPSLFLKYKPWLKVYHGCVPFPAVNAAGQTSGGLKNTGFPNGKCSSSVGQVYCRGNTYPDKFAMMYSWYMPKDQPIGSATGNGHRHEWESIVVWLSSENANAKFLGLAYSGHGGYTKVKASGMSRYMDGSRPKIGYYTSGVTNHELKVVETKGREQPLIDRNALTVAARKALEETNFGSANVPFKTENFYKHLEKAML